MAKFLYEEIITKFRCPMNLVSDEGCHFINDIIRILTKEFMILHRRSMTYYPQANGQVENTYKLLQTILTKMINANHTDWDTPHYGPIKLLTKLSQNIHFSLWCLELYYL